MDLPTRGAGSRWWPVRCVVLPGAAPLPLAELAAGGLEQLSGIEQVNRAVAQLDHMTQENSALVEEASAAIKSMASRSQAMSDMLDRYKLGDEQSSRAAGWRYSASRLRVAARGVGWHYLLNSTPEQVGGAMFVAEIQHPCKHRARVLSLFRTR